RWQVQDRGYLAFARPYFRPHEARKWRRRMNISLPLLGTSRLPEPFLQTVTTGNSWKTPSDSCRSFPFSDTVRTHTGRTDGRMATFSRLPSGKWRAQIKLRGIRESRAFSTRQLAIRWAAEREAQIEHEQTAGPERTRT